MVDRKNKIESEESEVDEEDDDSKESDSRDSDEESDDVANLSEKKSKRMRSKYAICRNCKSGFDVTENGEEKCVWHEGTY